MTLTASGGDFRRILALVIPVAALLAAVAIRRAPGVGAGEPVDVGTHRLQRDDTVPAGRVEEDDPVTGAARWTCGFETAEVELIGSRAALRAASPALPLSLRGLTGRMGQRTKRPEIVLPNNAPELGHDESPPDLPMADDVDQQYSFGRGVGDDRDVLFFQGRVDVFEINALAETEIQRLLALSSLNQGVNYVEPAVPVLRLQEVSGGLNQGITYREPPEPEARAQKIERPLNQGVDYTAP